jgi:hypothetical protein
MRSYSYSTSSMFCEVIMVFMSSQKASFKGLYTALLILIMTLHGCSLLENAGAYSPE